MGGDCIAPPEPAYPAASSASAAGPPRPARRPISCSSSRATSRTALLWERGRSEATSSRPPTPRPRAPTPERPRSDLESVRPPGEQLRGQRPPGVLVRSRSAGSPAAWAAVPAPGRKDSGRWLWHWPASSLCSTVLSRGRAGRRRPGWKDGGSRHRGDAYKAGGPLRPGCSAPVASSFSRTSSATARAGIHRSRCGVVAATPLRRPSLRLC
jgi:hypothetical protein